MAKRYRHLSQIISEVLPLRIMEIGTSRGIRAQKMVREAAQQFPDDPEEVLYVGIDFFDPSKLEGFVASEGTSHEPYPMDVVYKLLSPLTPQIILLQGDSQLILPNLCLAPMDLIYIDGGHDTTTISNDWNNVQRFMHKDTVVVFDDYWTESEIPGGCKELVSSLDSKEWVVEILPKTDRFARFNVNMVRVQRVQP